MLRDLREADGAGRPLQTDVVVIGGGIAGLLLGTRLAKRGIRTVILESGGQSEAPAPHPLNAVAQVGQPYRGAEAGRYRGLGGTSLRWGGAMLPFLPCDLGPHTAGWPIDWPVSLDELSGYFAEIEQLFRLPGGPFETAVGPGREAGEPSFIVRSAKWPAFRRRNVAGILKGEIRGPRLEVWVNATATRFHLGENGRIAAVVATGPSGTELRVEPRTVILAAGAIESTRLMLLLNAQHENRVFGTQGPLGRYFFDHLSAPAAMIDSSDHAALNRAFGIRFEGAGMRDFRMEPGPLLRQSYRLPGAFVHMAPRSIEESGFAALRAIYRDLQSRSGVNWRNFIALQRDMTWFLEAIWWRFAERRLLAPRNSIFELVLVMEQMPHAENTITLAKDRRDYHGNPLAQINWGVRAEDVKSFRALQSMLTAYWAGSRFAALGLLTPIAESIWRQRLLEESDIFHPGGTTRMSRDSGTGIVDSNLRAFRVDNLFVVSTSAFPSGGGANPTFMLMAFALRAADRIAAELLQESKIGDVATEGRARTSPVHAHLE